MYLGVLGSVDWVTWHDADDPVTSLMCTKTSLWLTDFVPSLKNQWIEDSRLNSSGSKDQNVRELNSIEENFVDSRGGIP
ncbi:hypothetical protein DI09_398p10 [Mitosporidium daphniae]|uniref:Uncharacterized protein n=1 Tax=Mitosporidium daphniae TaxID=1485682 RepID=A0A098VQM7_9MICR|nr:hypothetical protein DI09_398p10 [Mitosporidium daphniae]|eukprot:XP_013237763.1 uncharacterized protein DI09_398p10 [Mitosporidium daphniae]